VSDLAGETERDLVTDRMADSVMDDDVLEVRVRVMDCVLEESVDCDIVMVRVRDPESDDVRFSVTVAVILRGGVWLSVSLLDVDWLDEGNTDVVNDTVLDADAEGDDEIVRVCDGDLDSLGSDEVVGETLGCCETLAVADDDAEYDTLALSVFDTDTACERVPVDALVRVTETDRERLMLSGADLVKEVLRDTVLNPVTLSVRDSKTVPVVVMLRERESELVGESRCRVIVDDDMGLNERLCEPVTLNVPVEVALDETVIEPVITFVGVMVIDVDR